MRTKTLFGTVAALALMGGMATAQTMDEPDRLFYGVDAGGERIMTDAGDPLIVRRDGTEVAMGDYEIDADGVPRLIVVTEEDSMRLGANEEMDAEGNRVITRQATAGVGGEFIVEQAEPSVEVMVDEPVVTVDQATPEVTVRQPQPEITVTQAQPRVQVEQQAPIITVTQEQPIVTVRIPEPVVTIRMPAPDVNVATSEPQVSMDVPQPVVRFVRPEPKILIEEAEPQIEVMQAEAVVNVNRAQEAEVMIEQAEAEVTIEEAPEAEVTVTEADPVVNVEEADGAVIEVEQAEAVIDVEEAEANVNVMAESEMLMETERRSAGLIVAEEDDAMREQRLVGYGNFAEMGVTDLVGRNVLAASGEDVGEIDNVGMIGDRIVAIVGVGGFLGLGEHDVALPLERFSMTGDELIVTGMSAEMLENMEEYDDTTVRFLPADSMIGDAYN